MRIILHVGLHRTGTTALQRALDGEASRLAAAGTWFAQTPVVRPAVANQLFAAEWSPPLRPISRLVARRRIRAFLRRLEAEGFRRVILSDETMLGHLDRALGPAGPYPQAAARLSLLAEALAPWPTEAMLTLRPPAAWYASAWSFNVTRRDGRGWEETAALALASPRGFDDVALDVAAAFPRPRIWTADFYRRDAGAVHAWLAGPEGADIPRPAPEVNPSLSAPALAEVRRRRAAGEVLDRDALHALRLAHPVARDGAFDPWTPEQRATLDRRWAEQLAALAAAGLPVAGGEPAPAPTAAAAGERPETAPAPAADPASARAAHAAAPVPSAPDAREGGLT